MKPLLKFIPIRKAVEQKDGTLLVSGLATAELPDQDNEVCDYESTKPYYKALVARYAKTTGKVDGMETSLFPVREMHQLICAGAGRSIEFDDAAKTIDVTIHVVDQGSVAKVKAGALMGFSQGGDYIKTWKKGDLTYYTADPGEISLVDSPCLKEAVIESLIEKTFSYEKLDGSTELRKFRAEKKDTSDPPRERYLKLEQELQDLKKKLEEQMKPELKAILEKLAKADADTVTLTKKEAAELTEFSKAHAPILEHLHAMHKAAQSHCDDMHDHVSKCYKALGHEGMKAAESKDDKADKVEMTKAELDAKIAEAVEKAKKPAEEQPLTLTKADLDKRIADAIKEARGKEFDPADPANKAKLTLVSRDGKTLEPEKVREGSDGRDAVGF